MCRSPHPLGCQLFSRQCSAPAELTFRKLVPVLGAAPSMSIGRSLYRRLNAAGVHDWQTGGGGRVQTYRADFGDRSFID